MNINSIFNLIYTSVRKEDLYQSLVKGDVDHANEILGDILSRSISYFYNEESFYHGFLLGLFSGKKIKSNQIEKQCMEDLIYVSFLNKSFRQH